jgi:transposase
MCNNTRFFYDAVAPFVDCVKVVNTSQFQVISRSVSKTDKNDAKKLAKYLEKDMLPTVRLKDTIDAQLASLISTRDRQVKSCTANKNIVNNRCAQYGMPIDRGILSTIKGLDAVEKLPFSAVVKNEIKMLVDSIRYFKNMIDGLEKQIADLGNSLKGFDNLVSITGIGLIGATTLLTTIGDINDFPTEGKLFAYFGVVPSVSNSNQTMHTGHITKRGSKIGRTVLVQCGLSAQKHNPYLKSFYNRVKARGGAG